MANAKSLPFRGTLQYATRRWEGLVLSARMLSMMRPQGGAFKGELWPLPVLITPLHSGYASQSPKSKNGFRGRERIILWKCLQSEVSNVEEGSVQIGSG